jgi:peptidoglycan-associated lipoprotein
VVIEGHADERGTTEYNMALGSRRADTVRAYLKDLGVGAVLTTISFGKELPLVGGTGEEAWRQNRRAELRLPGDKRSDGFKVAN